MCLFYFRFFVVGFLVTFLFVCWVITILAKIFEGFLGFISLDSLNRLAGVFLFVQRSVCADYYRLKIYRIIFFESVLKFAPKIFPSFKSVNEPQQNQRLDANDSDKFFV